jgi:cytochrome c oxidase subunit IV
VEDKMVSITEVKSTIALAIAGAFGFIIALIWRDIIVGLMNMAGLSVSSFADATGAAIATVTAVVITIICVIGILYITKWGGVIKE